MVLPVLEQSQEISQLYDLISNITLNDATSTGKDVSDTSWKTQQTESSVAWRIQLRCNKSRDPKLQDENVNGMSWLDLQDLSVDKIENHKIFLNETYLQVSLSIQLIKESIVADIPYLTQIWQRKKLSTK